MIISTLNRSHVNFRIIYSLARCSEHSRIFLRHHNVHRNLAAFLSRSQPVLKAPGSTVLAEADADVEQDYNGGDDGGGRTENRLRGEGCRMQMEATRVSFAIQWRLSAATHLDPAEASENLSKCYQKTVRERVGGGCLVLSLMSETRKFVAFRMLFCSASLSAASVLKSPNTSSNRNAVVFFTIES
jgi:hypothetical protein